MNALPSRTTFQRGAVLWLSAAFLWALPTSKARSADEEPSRGIVIKVQNPITDATRTSIENRIDREKNLPGPPLKKVFFEFNPDNNDAATTSFGASLDLARYIKSQRQNGITAIAFVSGKVTRNSVLPVLACTDRAITSDGKIGEITGGNDIVQENDKSVYAEFAGREHEAVVTKMLDKSVEVISGFDGGKVIYVDAKKAGKEGPFANVVPRKGEQAIVFPQGNVVMLNAEQAVKYLGFDIVDSKEKALERYGISKQSEGVPDKIKAVKIELVGTINEAFKQRLDGQLKEAVSRNENMIFFMLECSGGSAKVAREIADQIRELKNDKKEPFKTVAFIPVKAPDLATFIAFACSDIVMYKGSEADSEAVLGEFEQFLQTAGKSSDSSNNVDYIRRNLEEIADGRGFEKILVEGMLDRNIALYRVKNKTTGSVQLVTGVELQADEKGKKEFSRPDAIKPKDSLLSFSASRAQQMRISQNTVANRDIKEVYSLYGVSEKDVRDSKPTWIDDFARFLRRYEVLLVLMLIAFAGLILEFKIPGATIPGLVSLVCFVLFFWSQAYAHGATVYLAIALFVLGVILLGLEIFVIPGFGITGISGTLLVLVAVGLATLEKAPSTSEEWSEFAIRVMKMGLMLVASGAVAAVVARYLPKIPYANRLMLVPPTDTPDFDGSMPALPGAEQAAALLGQVGTAISVLRPAGMAKFGDIMVDVVTEGDYIEPSTPIQVIEVEGTRIVVKKV